MSSSDSDSDSGSDATSPKLDLKTLLGFTEKVDWNSTTSWDRTESAERDRLKRDLVRLIRPYKDAKERPPFTAGELIIIAGVILDNATSLTKSALLGWILMNFTYYNAKAISEYIVGQSLTADDHLDVLPLPEVVPGLHNARNQWDVPIVSGSRDEKTVYWTPTYDHEIPIVVPPRAGRAYMRRWLEEPREGVFPFWELPSELRNTIYERLLVISKDAGVTVLDDCKMHLAGRCEDARSRGRDEVGFEGDELNFRPAPEVLALLQTNKQVFMEAMPLFYGLNSFHCDTMTAAVDFLNRAGLERIKQLTTAAPKDSMNMSSSAPAMQNIAQVGKLRCLEIAIHDPSWVPMSRVDLRFLGRETRFTSFGQVPGFVGLAKACNKAEELKVKQGVKFEGWVRAEIRKLAASSAQKVAKDKTMGSKRKAKSTKGKANGEEDGGQELRAPRKKARKA